MIQYAQNKGDESSWLRKLMARRNKNVAAVALANKNARTIWALLAHDRAFRPEYIPVAVSAVAELNRLSEGNNRKRSKSKFKEEHFTDCTGNQDVMARLVRP